MILVLLAAAAISVSSIPEAPIATAQVQRVEPHTFNRYDYALYGGVVAYRALDFYSTEMLLGRGGHEYMLPKAVVETRPGFAAYSVGLAAAEIGASVYLHRHGHAKLARWADAVSVGSGAATDARNFSQIATQSRIIASHRK